MTDETTSEQYTPPEGWRLLEVGETLQEGDEYVESDYRRRYPTKRVGSTVGETELYIRRIERPQSQPLQVREGRWKTRLGMVKDVTAMPTDHDNFAAAYPWWDGDVTTWANNGRFVVFENAMDLLEYLGPIEEETEPEPQPQPQPIQVREGRWRTRGGEIRCLTPTPEDDGRKEAYPWCDRRHCQVWTSGGHYYLDDKSWICPLDLVEYLGPIEPEIGWQAEAIGRLQGEAHVLNMEIGGLQRQLAVAKAELATAAAVCQQLQIELDAAQQVPQNIADRFEEGWNQGTARAVETVLAWLEPVRLVDSPNLANETMQHLPQIMRHLTGLAQD